MLLTKVFAGPEVTGRLRLLETSITESPTGRTTLFLNSVVKGAEPTGNVTLFSILVYDCFGAEETGRTTLLLNKITSSFSQNDTELELDADAESLVLKLLDSLLLVDVLSLVLNDSLWLVELESNVRAGGILGFSDER